MEKRCLFLLVDLFIAQLFSDSKSNEEMILDQTSRLVRHLFQVLGGSFTYKRSEQRF